MPVLHGFPLTHVIWHKIATDLRGYGDSGKPAADAEHLACSKRQMASDQVRVMTTLGFGRFAVVGHDRGGRVGHRPAPPHLTAEFFGLYALSGKATVFVGPFISGLVCSCR